MKILAFDTSNQAMSVAVVVDSVPVAETTLNQKKTHSEQLLPTIEHLMAVAKLTPADLDRVVVADGPGSYTGIRIAVTTAKTLAYTAGVALVGISSLAALAAKVVGTPALIVPVMDARRQNVFAGIYQWHDGQLVSVVADRHLALADLLAEVKLLKQPAVFVGSDLPKFTSTIKETLGAQASFSDDITSLPQASRLALLGATAEVSDAFNFVPSYLRLTEAETNWLKTHEDKGQAAYVEKV